MNAGLLLIGVSALCGVASVGSDESSRKGPAVPLTYARAAEAAIASSDELRVENARVSLREGARLWSLRAFFPSVSVALGEDDRLSLSGADSFAKTASVSAEQLIWDGGRAGVSRELESAELRLARAAVERKTREVAESAIGNYRSLLSARSLLAIRRANVESLSEQRRILAMEVFSGLAREDDLAEADIRVEDAALDAAAASLDVEAAERALADSLGMEALPPLAERIDVEKRAFPIGEALSSALADAAKAAHPDLEAARLSIAQRRAQARLAAASWAPTIKLNGSVVLSGDSLPLTRSSWSLGLAVDFTGPFLKGSSSASASWEPPYDRTAGVSAKATPFPDPGAALSGKAAGAELGFEIAKYGRSLSAVDREMARAVASYSILDRKAVLARRSRDLSRKRLDLARLSAEMGRSTRIELMEAALEEAKAEASLVQAATALIEGERVLERFLDAPPGSLGKIAERLMRGR